MKHLISIKTTNGLLSVADFKAQRVEKADVIGVVLQTETIGMIISLDKWHEIWCSDENDRVFNKACSAAEALQTLSGLELTRNIVEQNEEDGEDMTAAMRCWQYNKGDLQWYLPCLYELGAIIAYRDKLNEVFKVLAADILDEHDWGWSSSESRKHNVWGVSYCNGNLFSNGKESTYVVRAVSAFSPLERGDSSLRNENDSQLTEASAIEYLRKFGYTGELVKRVSI